MESEDLLHFKNLADIKEARGQKSQARDQRDQERDKKYQARDQNLGDTVESVIFCFDLFFETNFICVFEKLVFKIGSEDLRHFYNI